jgi:hypothetical protein
VLIKKTTDGINHKKLEIVSDNNELLTEFLSSAENKDVFYKIFDYDAESLYMDKENIEITINLKNINKNKNYEQIKTIYDLVIKIKDALKKYEIPNVITTTTIKQKYIYYFLISIPVLAIGLSLFFTVYLSVISKQGFDVMDTFELFLKGTILFLPIGLIYHYIGLKFIKKLGYSYKKLYVVDSLLAIWFIVSLPFIMALNGYFDRSSVETLEFDIIDKFQKKNSCWLVINNKNFNSLSKKFFNYNSRIAVRREEYFNIVPGRTKIRINFKKGFIRIKWIKSYSFQNVSSKN